MSEPAAVPADGLRVLPLRGLPEVTEGADLASLILGHAPTLYDGDVIAVSSKVVSKSEGRVVLGGAREEAIDAETVRVIARRGDTRIVETRHGFVMAAAGVDNSNVEPGRLVLLPRDPDGSARAVRAALSARTGRRLGVLVTDTFGRPWRIGQTDLAIGAAGVQVLDDHGGGTDAYGNPLAVTAPAHADELASAAELVMGKLAGVPATLIRGLSAAVTEQDGPGVRALVRGAETDMFRLGSRETSAETVRLPRGTEVLRTTAPDAAALEAALSPIPNELALTPVEDEPARSKLAADAGLGQTEASLFVACLPAEASGDASALLEAGAAIDALLLRCAVAGLATRWVRPRELDLAGVRALVGANAGEPLGLIALSAR